MSIMTTEHVQHAAALKAICMQLALTSLHLLMDVQFQRFLPIFVTVSL